MGIVLTICHWWIVGMWLAFAVYWTVAAISARRVLNRSSFRASRSMHLAMIVVVLAAVILTRRSSVLHQLQSAIFSNMPLAVCGAIVATAGAALAFTARAAIGGNWGPPQTRRTDTDLITSGPYAFVRHPIYSGVLLMMIGTAMGLIMAWWLVVIAAGIYFVVSARAEERHMTERFPRLYPAYRARTKMLVPFLW